MTPSPPSWNSPIIYLRSFIEPFPKPVEKLKEIQAVLADGELTDKPIKKLLEIRKIIKVDTLILIMKISIYNYLIIKSIEKKPKKPRKVSEDAGDYSNTGAGSDYFNLYYDGYSNRGRWAADADF